VHGVGGSIEESGVILHANNDVSICAPYNPVSNLPELELCPIPTSSKVWHSTFSDVNPEFLLSDSELLANLTVLDDTNRNLQQSQKELLLWHQRLSHINLSKVHLLTKPKQWVKVSSSPVDSLHVDAILPTKHGSTSKCDHSDLKCAACLMAKAHRRTPPTPSNPSTHPPEMVLKTDHLAPGKCVSCDHYVSPVRGRCQTGFGRTTSTHGFVGGALYVDHASGKIFHHPQTDLTASTTIRGKQIVEAAASDLGFKI
jgi:hypothetical protein